MQLARTFLLSIFVLCTVKGDETYHNNDGMREWTVSDKSGNICMKMAMNATVDIGVAISQVPASATPMKQPDSCTASDKSAAFILSWVDATYTWTLMVYFDAKESSYSISEVNGTYVKGFSFGSWSYTASDLPSAPLGKCMTCSNYEASSALFNQYKFQPFAQRSNEDYGSATECSFGMSKGLFYLIFVVFVLALIASIGGIAFCCYKRKTPGYGNI